MKVIYLLIIISLGFAIQGMCQEKKYKPVDYPDGYTAQIDVVYTREDGWEGRMDLYTDPASKQPTPVVLNIHGGGWNHGEKESQTGFGSFFRNGYAVANVEYRLVGVAPAPAAIEDCRCALIYLFKHAEALNIDTGRIVVMGASAGGHLALMTGLLANDRKFDAACEYDGKIKVAAIIDKYGPTDLVPLARGSSVKKWLGDGYGNRQFMESVSPLYYISKTSPPVFIVHGDKDPLVPYEQSVLLYKKLKANNVKTSMVTIAGGGHGRFSQEEKSMISKKMWVFLKEAGLQPVK